MGSRVYETGSNLVSSGSNKLSEVNQNQYVNSATTTTKEVVGTVGGAIAGFSTVSDLMK
jgi:hypothetical protein